MDKQYFIRTTDESTYKQLLSQGFTLVAHDKRSWTFLNDKGIEDLSFAKDGKFSYTNKLNM